MISKSLSKVGKSKEVLSKENEMRLKAVFKLGLLEKKKIRAVMFNFFVTFEEYCKQVGRESVVGEMVKGEEIGVRVQCQAKQKSILLTKELKLEGDSKLTIDKMVQCIEIVNEKEYSLDNKLYGFVKIFQQSKLRTKFKSAINTIDSVLSASNRTTKIHSFQLLKSRNNLIDRLELFTSLISVTLFHQQISLLKSSFSSLHQLSTALQQQSQTDSKSKQLTQDHSLLSLKQHFKELQRQTPRQTQTPILELRFTKDEIFQVEPTSKSMKAKRFFCRQDNYMKSPSVSAIEVDMSVNSTYVSNILGEKGMKEARPFVPPQINIKTYQPTLPKQQQKFFFFSRAPEHTPHQVHKLHPHTLSSQVQDTTEPFNLFNNLCNSSHSHVFRQVNHDISQAQTHRDPSPKPTKTRKQKVISLKNSFIQPPKQLEYPFSNHTSKVFTLSSSRKSIGLKSSRRIKESCVGQEWERVLDLTKLMKTESLQNSKNSPKKETIKITASATSRSKCINAMNFGKDGIFRRNYQEMGKGTNQAKKISSICSEFLSRLSKP